MSQSITTQPAFRWDEIDPDSLLQLVNVRKMSTEFGYLLRHYWLPDTDIRFQRVTEQFSSTGAAVSSEQVILQQPVKCDADKIVWRERVLDQQGNENSIVRCFPPRNEETICIYNRSGQTFRQRLPLEFEQWPAGESDAMNQAFLQQPLLTPLLPIPVGFQWHVSHDDQGYLDYTLESVVKQGEMTVLFIRRHGRFRLEEYYHDGERRQQTCMVEREGITAYALERSLILQDRTRDVFRCRESGGLLDGMETRTTQTLIRSEWRESRRNAPLFVKFPTEGGHRNLYDCGTGKLLRVDETTYDIIDDYRVLTDEEIVTKYTARHGEEQVADSLALIRETAAKGFLADHPPAELTRIEVTEYDRKQYELGDYWQKAGVLLILGITERCNLHCEYCCYSGQFTGQRTHSNRSMSWGVAERAMTDYIEREQVGNKACSFSFYGGEPLLEFELLKRCVAFAEEKAGSLGKETRFAITTNGTLLRDEVVDYLVEHRFLVMISLDGPQPHHDRYRVFPDGSGSFESVHANVLRFAERYPDYRSRGLSMTLAPPLDLDATAALYDELHDLYPMSRAALVNTGTEQRFMDGRTCGSTRYGCHDACKHQSGLPVFSGDFRKFLDDDFRQMNDRWKSYLASVKKHGVTKTRELTPLNALLFEQQMTQYHRRKVVKEARDWYFFIPCVPGFTRRFCDVAGNYRVCERVDNSETYQLGNVWDGPDPNKLTRTLELRRHFGDCANCTALKTCDLCYARIPDSDAVAEDLIRCLICCASGLASRQDT